RAQTFPLPGSCCGWHAFAARSLRNKPQTEKAAKAWHTQRRYRPSCLWDRTTLPIGGAMKLSDTANGGDCPRGSDPKLLGHRTSETASRLPVRPSRRGLGSTAARGTETERPPGEPAGRCHLSTCPNHASWARGLRDRRPGVALRGIEGEVREAGL